MSKEIEFEKWWAHTGLGVNVEHARHIWNAAWTAERLDDQAAWDKGHAAGAEAERKFIESKLHKRVFSFSNLQEALDWLEAQ